MSLADYQAELTAASKLKLRATALLALGRPDEVFEASVLLHAAARRELRAVRGLSVPTQTRIGALTEACGLLVDARDPAGAGRVYADLLKVLHEDADGAPVPPKLDRAYGDLQARFAAAQADTMMAALPPWALRSGFARARREAASMTRVFPGVATWWSIRFHLAERQGDLDEAWGWLERAQLLEPDDEKFFALRLRTSHVRPTDEVDALFDQGYRRLKQSSAQFCLFYALAELLQHRRHPERALEAAQLGLTKSLTEEERQRLRAAQLFAQVFMTGQTPSAEQLYLAGMADLAVQVKKGDDVTQLLLKYALRAA